MDFRTLKPLLCVATIAVFTLSCKDARTTEEPAAVEQKSETETHDHPHTETAAPQETPAGEVTLNPPHGQPGHRCDIAVGQPLDAKPKQEGDAKVNPPHGQPGHRCDLAVGAPLPE